jgi:hypothetical protein
MRPAPGKGWEKGGMYRMAHEKALEGDYRSCITMKDENYMYEILFRKALNRILIRGEKYEAVKAKNRQERKIAKEFKDKEAIQLAKEKEDLKQKEDRKKKEALHAAKKQEIILKMQKDKIMRALEDELGSQISEQEIDIYCDDETDMRELGVDIPSEIENYGS